MQSALCKSFYFLWLSWQRIPCFFAILGWKVLHAQGFNLQPRNLCPQLGVFDSLPQKLRVKDYPCCDLTLTPADIADP